MAGSSMTFTFDSGIDSAGSYGGVKKVLASWVSDDSAGTASGTVKVVGQLVKIVTDPGPAAPSDNWDVVITDAEGVDVTAGCMNAAALIARDTANSEETYLYLKEASATPVGIGAFPVVCDVLTVAVANAGNSKSGQIILYYKPG